MRHAFLAGLALLWSSSVAIGQTEVERVIDRAIQAHGGAANLARLKARHCKTRGQAFRGTPVPFTQEVFAQSPNQIKEIMQFPVSGVPASVVATVLNGSAGHMEINGKSQPLDDAMLNELREAAHLAHLVRLVDLKSQQLFSLGESVVSGRPARAVRVSSPGRRDVQLYFDREFGVLVKAERTVVDLRTKQAQREEAFYTDWKVADGLVTPTKVTVLRDGYKFSEVEVLEVHFFEKLDDKVFAQP